MGRHPIEMSGKKFGKLTVLHRDGSDKYSKPMFLCKCDCGKLTRVKGNYLRIGKTKSCGCLTTATHGMSTHPLWGIWNQIKQRCYNPNTKSFSYCGAKGVKLVKEWHDSSAFIHWCLENGWKPGLTIDRIDPSGDYEAANCQFITRAQNVIRKEVTGKNIGKVFGTWKIVSRENYDIKVTVQCIYCNKKDYIMATNVSRGTCRQCKCKKT